MKPNYRQERMSRERSKNAKRQEKLKRREEDAAERKARREREGQGGEPQKT
jgi:hypothetical protein